MQDEKDALNLTEEEARAAAKAVMTLFQRWQLTDDEARDLLGQVPDETWSAWKAGRFGPVSPELGARLSHLLGVRQLLPLERGSLCRKEESSRLTRVGGV